MIPQAVWEVSEEWARSENGLYKGDLPILASITPGTVPATEEAAKKRGIARAESANWRNVQLAREIAREIYLHHGAPVSADDVRVEMSLRFPDQTYGNWMGACFRRSEWEPAGFVLSRTKGSHSNRLLTWRLRSVRRATEGDK